MTKEILVDNYKIFVFDLDNTLYLHKANFNYKEEYDEKVRTFLKELKMKNKILCILTHNRKPMMYLESMKIESFFDKIIFETRNICGLSANYISNYTPKDEMISIIIEEFKCNLNEIIFFDDNSYNIKQIESIGIESIKVSPKDGICLEEIRI
jgi:HAD superfamily phosphatase (TIGR01681 family)